MTQRINSNRKGKDGERSFRDKLVEFGFRAERGSQREGSPDSPDIRCNQLPFHFEVKFRERINLRDAYLQASCECGQKIAVVAHRSTKRGTDPSDLRGTEPWMITLSADDFLRLVQHSDLI